MENVIKAYMGIFFLMLLFITGISIVKAQNNAENARDFRTQVCIQMEDSNYDAKVINSLLELASDNEYELEIKLRNEDNTLFYINKDNLATDDNTKNINGGVLELKYYYELPLFSSRTEHSIYGISR